MSDTTWLTLIGLGEDGPEGLCTASADALAQATYVMGAERHLHLLPNVTAQRVNWPVPFAAGVEQLMARRGRATVVLASGDPFWFGVGTTLTKRLARHEWQAFPGRSTFSLVAARLGWPLENTLCLGLHAAPLLRLRPYLAPRRRIIVTLRDGNSVTELGCYLNSSGFGASSCTVLEAVGGPRERVTEAKATALVGQDFEHPVSVAIEVSGPGDVLPVAPGRADDWFDHDGQITKHPIRALTLAALAPRPHEHLWDIGAGSGSIGIEWLLADPSLQATAIEQSMDRVDRTRANAAKLGVERLHVLHGTAHKALQGLPPPDAVFVGGCLSLDLLSYLETLAVGTRLVVNAVTLETEAMLTHAQVRLGGQLIRLVTSQAVPLGPKRGWRAAYPITQWSHVL